MEAILALIAGMVIGAFLVIIIAVLLEGRSWIQLGLVEWKDDRRTE